MTNYECYKCSKIKPEFEFSPSRLNKLGRRKLCRVCANSYRNTSEQRQKRTEQMRNYRHNTGQSKKFYKQTLVDDSGRECTRCKQYKVWDDFYEQQGKKNTQCKICWRVTCWEGRMRRNFGLTPDDYDWLLNLQDSLCALCKQPEVKSSYNQSEDEVQRFAVDHWHGCLNHVESKGCKSCIRGLLCSSCNVLLGHVEGRKLLEGRFADYLSRRPFPIIEETV